MATETAQRDPNYTTTIMGVSLGSPHVPTQIYVDETTHRLLTSTTFTGVALPIAGATTAIGVAIVDGTGNQITSFGGGVEYTDGATPPANPVGKVLVFDSAGTWKDVGTDQPLPVAANIKDSLGNTISAFPATFLRTTDEPHQLMYDPFDGALDTTNTWTATTANSGVAASSASGTMSLGTGTVANGWSKLVTIPTFRPTVPAWIGFSFLNIIPDLAAPTNNATRFFGSGTPLATPTLAGVMQDGIGFELVNSTMYCVLYAGGVRTVIQDLSVATGNGKQPTDASGHRYIIYIRTDKVYFYIDGLTSTQLVATGNFTYPNIQTAPMSFVAVGGATPPVSNSQIQSVGATVWDTGKNNVTQSDPVYPWRRQTVKASGAAVVADDMGNFEAQKVTLVAGTDTIITFAQSVRLVRIKNFDTANQVLVKNSAIATNTDAASDYVGVAPVANVPSTDYFPYITTTIHLRSAGNSVVSLTGFF